MSTVAIASDGAVHMTKGQRLRASTVGGQLAYQKRDNVHLFASPYFPPFSLKVTKSAKRNMATELQSSAM